MKDETNLEITYHPKQMVQDFSKHTSTQLLFVAPLWHCNYIGKTFSHPSFSKKSFCWWQKNWDYCVKFNTYFFKFVQKSSNTHIVTLIDVFVLYPHVQNVLLIIACLMADLLWFPHTPYKIPVDFIVQEQCSSTDVSQNNGQHPLSAFLFQVLEIERKLFLDSLCPFEKLISWYTIWL